MGGQSKRMSMIESIVNVASGYLIAVVVYMIVLPLYGLPVTVSQSLQVTLIFSIVSVIRLYLMRRVFNLVYTKIKR